MPTPYPRRQPPKPASPSRPAARRRHSSEFPSHAFLEGSAAQRESRAQLLQMPATRILPPDPQRAQPTAVYVTGERRVPTTRPRHELADSPDEEVTQAITIQGSSEEIPEVVRVSPAFLIIDRGPAAGTTIPVPEGETHIGRAQHATLRIEHASVSRMHAAVRRSGNRFFVRDLGSHNGTWVNGHRIKGEVQAFGGDEIVVGRAVLTLRAESQAIPTGRARAQPARKASLTEQAWFPVAIFVVAVAVGAAVVVALVASPAQPREAVTVPVSRTAVTTGAVAPAREVSVVIEETNPEPVTTPSNAKLATQMDRRPEEHKTEQIRLGAGELSAKALFHATRNNRPAPKPAKTRQAPATRPQASRPEPTGESAAALAKFEAGDVDGAIAAADGALATKLKTFKSEVTAAKSGLAAHDGAGAIKHYTIALRIDDELSKGWGKQSGEIRSQLAKLYVMAAKSVFPSDPAKAKKLAEKALDYDAKNDEAEAIVSKAESAAPAPAAAAEPVAAPAPGSRSAADEAFGQ